MRSILGFTFLMPTSSYGSGFESVLHDPITVFFMLAIISATFFFAVYKFDRFAILHGPEILTTMGIFGCFVGIALALLKFDATNITASVPLLLNGVKTAFWASVFGVGGALIIKTRQRFSKGPILDTTSEPRASSLEDVVQSIILLRKSIAGDDDSSLINQFKLMRNEQADASKALKASLDDFANKVSELGSKALIEALEKVIRDFNTQLNEQFGENFKQLNSAVEKLVIWQQQYKEELDKLGAIQKQAADDLKRSSDAFSIASEKSKAFTESAENLAKLLQDFDSQYNLMKTSQQALSAVLIEMKSVEPSFSQKLKDLIKTFSESTQELSTCLQDQMTRLTEHIAALNTEFKKTTSEHLEKYGELLKETIPKIQHGVNAEIANTNKNLQENFQTLEKNLETELEKSLITLGQQLASLSEKFVRDYTPLTERLREVVNITKGV